MDERAAAILKERFGGDSVISLATAVDNVPDVRSMNACYWDGAFYGITHALSGKMRQLAENPVCAVSGEWFSGHGLGENLGWVGRAENAECFGALRRAFAQWIDNGHNDFSDENCVILRIRLTDGVLFSMGARYDLDFSEEKR